MLEIILLVSTVMWYIIDRLKVMWADLTYGKWITVGVSAVFAFVLAFFYHLDFMAAVGVTEAPTVIGTILTGFIFMGGSSALSELIKRLKE